MLDRAQALADQMVAWRREFHMHPELGFHESRTAGRVAEVLSALGYQVRTGVGGTGVVGERGAGSPIVAIRADMDALPIQEANDVPYASQVPGVMHACGHDAHTAIALGVATLLAQETLPGTIRFLFQPAEEVADEEGLSGAPRMVEDGAMDGVDYVLALHVDGSLPAGDIGLQAGPATAGVDDFHATIVGRGGHGAAPHDAVDPIYLTGHAILALHGIVSRRLRPCDAAVISIGALHGGQANNVIPAHVEMGGTIRFTSLEVRERIHTEIERALGIVRALGGEYKLQFIRGGLPTMNNVEVTTLLRQVATDLLGAERIALPQPAMWAEDFAILTDLAPGVLLKLGCGLEGPERQLHSPDFDLDERCLPIGAGILAEAAVRLLRQDPLQQGECSGPKV